MTRIACLLVLLAPAALPQLFSFGVKGGVPLTDAFKGPARFSLRSEGGTYAVGPAVELNLPFRLSFEIDALYRPVRYQSETGTGTTTRVSGSSWEFPGLLKYRLTGGPARPYLAAGLAFRNLRGFRDNLPELRKRSAAGAVLGGGLELRVPFIRLSGELRYTRWGSTNFQLGGFRSQLNQAEFLLGLMF